MAFKVSTGLRDYMLDTGSLRDGLNLCELRLYAGAVPDSADASLAGATLLATITVDDGGTGLTFEPDAVAGILSKEGDETWQGTILATGVATFFRLVLTTDTGAMSTTERRAQGTVGQVAADLNLSNTSLVAAGVQTINHFNVALPTL